MKLVDRERRFDAPLTLNLDDQVQGIAEVVHSEVEAVVPAEGVGAEPVSYDVVKPDDRLANEIDVTLGPGHRRTGLPGVEVEREQPGAEGHVTSIIGTACACW